MIVMLMIAKNVYYGCFVANVTVYVVSGLQVIDKRFFSEAFLFKPRGLNRKPRKNPLFSLKYGAGANKHVLLTPGEIYIRSSQHPA